MVGRAAEGSINIGSPRGMKALGRYARQAGRREPVAALLSPGFSR